MAFRLRKDRKSKNKSRLLKRLKELEAKKSLTPEEKVEIEKILAVLDRKRNNKIESKKLNNNKQNEIAVSIYNGDDNLTDLNTGHLQSAAGQYRRGRINNMKK